MSWSAPVSYSAAAPQLGVPAILDSDPLLQFKGARSVIKSLPAATGSSIGPNSQVQFLIPQSMNGYIKPNSMYLKCKITITQADDADNLWTFAGQNGTAISLFSNTAPVTTAPDVATLQLGNAGPGGASSVIDRLTVTFPGGVQMSYPMYDKFHWGILLNHMLSREYVRTDLKMLEMAETVRVGFVTGSDNSVVVTVCIPLDLPVFNAASALPLLLLSGGITLDLVTNSVTAALHTVTTNASNFALSEMTLVYEELQVSPEFKSALQQKVSVAPYSIGVADRTWLGLCDGSASTRVNIGVGLSSMKALVGITTGPITDTSTAKFSAPNGLLRWNFYVNGQQVNSMQLDSDVQNYAEFTRAIQSLYDVDRVSDLNDEVSVLGSVLRSSYQRGQFAFGMSTAVYSDASFALSGIPVDQLSVEFERGTPVGDKWGIVTGPASNWVTHLWALHDSVLTILPDGTVSLRK